MSATPGLRPITIHIPASLHHLNLDLKGFLEYKRSNNISYTNLAVGACIFDSGIKDSPKPRLLLVQRATTERAFPNLWEVPGGSAEFSDPSILHSVARETFEETGLRLTRFVREIGGGVEFITPGNKKWLKLSFEIEVVELHGVPGETSDHAEIRLLGGEHIPITLDPEEHQRYAWVTEDEFRKCTTTSGPYPPVTEEQRQTILQAFALHDSSML